MKLVIDYKISDEIKAKDYLNRQESFKTADDLVGEYKIGNYIETAQYLFDKMSDSEKIFEMNLDKLVWVSSVIEGIGITLAGTKELMREVDKNIGIDEISKKKVVNILNAYRYVRTSYDQKFDYNYVNKIQKIINSGLSEYRDGIRIEDVVIKGTTYVPDKPKSIEYEKFLRDWGELEDINELIYYCMKHMKMQPYYDGNKRVSIVALNSLLLKKDKGIVVMDDKQANFRDRLVDYYENEDDKWGLLWYIKANLKTTII